MRKTMKRILLALILVTAFTSCNKDKETFEKDDTCIYYVDSVTWNEYTTFDEDGDPVLNTGYAIEYHLEDGAEDVELIQANEYQDFLNNDDYCH